MKPILVIQMQRMGDLILSFPLFLWLMRRYPGHPLWVAADPRFFRPLRPVGPAVRYLEPEDLPPLTREKFALVINLGHRKESLELAGSLDTEELAGGYLRRGVLRVAGAWQEYRMSLVHNNRHNRFHWADMNALDVIPAPVMAGTRWPEPRRMPPDVRRVGLFLGASAAEKRPSASFWAHLVRALERRGWTPLLLGGPAEETLCREVRELSGTAVASACGVLSLDRLAVLGQELAALITPDTGPMHLAAWTGLKVLNLSMGPVHAWETGPYQPGHVVLRSARGCAGCWECRFDMPRCHASFEPGRVARILDCMLCGQIPRGLGKGRVEMLGTGQKHGLYHLESLSGCGRISSLPGAYWQAFWMHALGLDGPDCRTAAAALREARPSLVRTLRRSSLQFFRSLADPRSPRTARPWSAWPPALRPLSGYISAHLSNHDFSPASLRRARSLAEENLLFLSLPE